MTIICRSSITALGSPDAASGNRRSIIASLVRAGMASRQLSRMARAATSSQCWNTLFSTKRSASAGLADFTIVDERYSDLDHGSDPPTPLLVADGLPLLWARVHGNGRVVYDALGHHPASYAVPEHREIVRRAIRWASGAEVEESA